MQIFFRLKELNILKWLITVLLELKCILVGKKALTYLCCNYEGKFVGTTSVAESLSSEEIIIFIHFKEKLFLNQLSGSKIPQSKKFKEFLKNLFFSSYYWLNRTSTELLSLDFAAISDERCKILKGVSKENLLDINYLISKAQFPGKVSNLLFKFILDCDKGKLEREDS
ncbi:hypothetical protein BpHYR1_045222 [Brachionus plicatilis]|uniref:Uncharacterized protein n=1 Tax=Brachionus plicatilis TaxID=10195 RepID=A0A3M7R468_BRAPC|nr:hypothetical protein BpHYR1_045222 [Brachionus plicatilis]